MMGKKFKYIQIKNILLIKLITFSLCNQKILEVAYKRMNDSKNSFEEISLEDL